MPDIPVVAGVGFAEVPVDRLQIILPLIGASVITWYDRAPGTELHHDPAPDIVDVDIPAETQERELKLIVPRQRRRPHHRIIDGIVVGMGEVQVQRNVARKILAVDQRRRRLPAGPVEPAEIAKRKWRAGRRLRRRYPIRVLLKKMREKILDPMTLTADRQGIRLHEIIWFDRLVLVNSHIARRCRFLAVPVANSQMCTEKNDDSLKHLIEILDETKNWQCKRVDRLSFYLHQLHTIEALT